MGLLDMFGGGGGSLAIQLGSQTVSAAGPLTGAVVFQGGKKAQQITNIKLKLVMEQTSMESALVNGQQVQQERTHSRDVIPFFEIAPAFQSTPGQAAQFPFNVELPMGLQNSTPKQVKYRLVATADIDNAIDPGTNVEIQIVGGAPVAQAAPAGAAPMAPPPSAPAPIQIGSQVMALWQDGNPYAAVVTAMQNGMIGVDWVNPQLGESSWLQPQQVQAQHAPPPSAKQPAMPAAQFAQQAGVQSKFDKQAAQQQAAPVGGKFDQQAAPVGGKFEQQQQQKGHDPYAKGGAPDPYAKGGAPDPYAKGAAPAPQTKGAAPAPQTKGVPADGALAIGTRVQAQHTNGQWYPGHVVAMQNGLIGVDWDDEKLGVSTWVQPQQVQPQGK